MTETRSARQIVIEEAFEDEQLRLAASFEATYTGNCAGGRPSDNARSAVRWVARARDERNPSVLASPTAQAVLADYLAAA